MASDARPRLRAKPLDRPFHVVLVEPEIPQNTGNIARLTAATKSKLHLVGRPRASASTSAPVRRVRWPRLLNDLKVEPRASTSTSRTSRHAHPTARLCLFTATAPASYLAAAFAPGDALVFGRESVGLDPDLVARHEGRVFGIPTLGAVRSLNLANAASIVLYEALRQSGALDATWLG